MNIQKPSFISTIIASLKTESQKLSNQWILNKSITIFALRLHIKSTLLKCFKHFNYSNKFGIFRRMLCMLIGRCLPLQQQHTDFNYEILFWFMTSCALTNCSGDCVWFLNSNSFLLRINATEYLHNIRRYLAKSTNSRFIREGSLFQPPFFYFCLFGIQRMSWNDIVHTRTFSIFCCVFFWHRF